MNTSLNFNNFYIKIDWFDLSFDRAMERLLIWKKNSIKFRFVTEEIRSRARSIWLNRLEQARIWYVKRYWIRSMIFATFFFDHANEKTMGVFSSDIAKFLSVYVIYLPLCICILCMHIDLPNRNDIAKIIRRKSASEAIPNE